jgi:predicted GH43/DUF377 family glycosyl hydrolase
MVFVKKEGILLESTKNEFENQGVLNPACMQKGNTVHMYYRAVKQGNYSSIGYCKLDGPLEVSKRWDKPMLSPEFDYEQQGVEDPRIVELDGEYHMTYVAFDGKNAQTAYATSKDMFNWKKKGLIGPSLSYDEAENFFRKAKLKEKYFFFESYYKDKMGPDVLLWFKDCFLFPKKIKGKLALVTRILPDMQIAYVNDMSELTGKFWKKYLKKLSKNILLSSKYWFESRSIGGGCPPIETDYGWLMIYHAVEDTYTGKNYHAAAALLDKNNPQKLIGVLQDPLFSPKEEWELTGHVNNVVFPTGTALFDDQLYIYYGAADKRIAVASLDIDELLAELLHDKEYTKIASKMSFNAGQILSLCRERPLSINELVKKMNAKRDHVLMALGWLARDGEIEYIELGKEIKVKSKV